MMAAIARRICGRASHRGREEGADTFLDISAAEAPSHSGREVEGADTFLDISAAEALFCAELLDPLSRDGMVGTKALVKGLTAGMRSETSTMTVAAVCLLSTTGKVAHDKVSVEDVKRLFRGSFHEHKGADDRVSLATLTSGNRFKAWAAASRFDVHQRQTVNSHSDFEELSRLCVLGREQSAICLVRSSWLQGQLAEARRTGDPFVVPSRNALPPAAAYWGPMTEERVFVVALSYCWAGPGQPDPHNKLIADVCKFLAYLDTARHFGDNPIFFGDDYPIFKKLNVGDREVLVFWDYPSLYQINDTSTGGVTLLQLDSFDRGLRSINVLYGHVGTMSLLCTKNYPVVSRTEYADSAWPYFEMLVSMLIKPANTAVNLPSALEWIRTKETDLASTDPADQANCNIYWLYQHVRRAHRQLPVLPSTFNDEIQNKTATNGSDITFLKRKFQETFEVVMGPAEKLQLMNIPGPTSAQWQLFLTETLRACPRLVHVDLSGNEAIANETLEPFANLHTLKFLSVNMCAGFKGSLEPLRRLFKLRFLYLYGCVALEVSVEPLSGLQELVYVDLEACFGLVAGLELLAPLPKLERLNVCDTQLNAASFIAERQRVLQLPQNAVMEMDGAPVVGGCRVGRYGNELTPLWRAAYYGQVETARRLLLGGGGGLGGVEVDRGTKNDGITPLIQATAEGFAEVVRVLIAHGADVNKAKHNGATPLYMAGQKGFVELTELLIKHRAVVNKARHDSWTPLLMAAQEGFVEVTKLLIKSRAEINQANSNLKTPINIAADNGHVAVVRVLLEKGADTTIKDKWGRDPLASAREKDHREVAALLMQ